MERSSSDVILSRKRNLLLRKKQKENKEIRCRIIPPAQSVSRVVLQESRSAQVLNPTVPAPYTSMSRAVIRPTRVETRDLCKTAHDGREKREFRSRWRLLPRRDELNVLRFAGER